MVVLIGTSEASLTRGIMELPVTVAKCRKIALKRNYAVTIVFTSDEVEQKFGDIMSQVLSECRGLNELLFQNLSKMPLHLTIANLRLGKNEEKEVEKLLRDYIKKKKVNVPLRVKICGIGTFPRNRSKANVVYAKVQSDALAEIINGIRELLKSHCLLDMKELNKREPIIPHVTLMNSNNLCKQEEDGFGKRATFDATEILEKFKDSDLGTATINEIILNELPLQLPLYESTRAVFKFN